MTVVEILYFAGCPAYRRARETTGKVMRELRPDWELKMVLVRHMRDAADLDFRGSPTVRLDGADIDPAGLAASGPPGLYSRTFRWKKRTFDTPPEEMLRDAFLTRRPPA